MKKYISLVIILSLALLGCMQSNLPDDISATSSKEPPTDLHTVKKIKEIKMPFSANILLTESGEVYTWGINEQGVLGLGLPEGEIVLTPTKLDFDDEVKNIEVNTNTNSIYAISTQGNVYAWGPNHYSIFPGVEEYILSSPVKIEFPFKVNAISHSFRFLTVEDETGNLYGCGWNMTGGTMLEPEMRKSVSSGELYLLRKNDGNAVSSFCNAGLYRVYLEKDGTVFVQGYLVDGDPTLSYNSFTQIEFPETIIKVGPLSQGMVCLSDTGNLYFIGQDRYGIAGIRQTENEAEIYHNPTKITKLSETIIDFQTSTTSIAVRTEDNKFYTWGYNLGRNVAESHDEIISTPNRLQIPEDSVYYTCGSFSGASISAEGIIYAWGSNGYYLFLEDEFYMQFEPQILNLTEYIQAN